MNITEMRNSPLAEYSGLPLTLDKASNRKPAMIQKA